MDEENLNDIHKEALANFKLYQEIESENIEHAVEAFAFAGGEHWNPKEKAKRILDGRPCLTFDHTMPFIKRITNDQRQNKPQIKIKPTKDGEEHIAKVIDGMVRSIQRRSSADIAYDTGYEHAVIAGSGYWRILYDFVDEMSTDQEIRIEPINDSTSVAMQPILKHSSGLDADWCFIYQDVLKETYKQLYPGEEIDNLSVNTNGNIISPWIGSDTVRIAEYFKASYRDDVLYVFVDGSKMLKSEIDKKHIEFAEANVKTKRETQIRVITWYKMNGKKILEKKEWPGKYIPIVRVVGNELVVKGKRKVWGIVKPLMDPQRMHNFWRTSETEMISKQPKATWLIADQQIGKYKKIWDNSHLENRSHLPYEHIDGIPMPQRISPAPSPIADINAALTCVDEMKAVTGIYDASLGKQSNETSAVAITARDRQGDLANFNYIDNQTRSLKYTGIILVDLIPKIYYEEQLVHILGPDEKEDFVKINSKSPNEKDGLLYDLSVGTYDVDVVVGPSYSTRRQESAAFLTEFMRTNPEKGGVIADIAMKNMDVPGAEEAAKRLRKTIDPALLEDENDTNGKPSEDQLMMVNDQLHRTVQEQQQYMDDIEKQLQVVLEENKQLKQHDAVELEKERLRSETTLQAKLIDQKTALAVEDKKQNTAHVSKIIDAEKDTHVAELNNMDKIQNNDNSQNYEFLLKQIEQLRDMIFSNQNVPAQSPGTEVEININPSSNDDANNDDDSNPNPEE